MCGLYGAMSLAGLTHTEMHSADLLGYVSVERGKHSTGVGLLTRIEENKIRARVLKEAVPSGIYYNSKDYDLSLIHI